MTWVLRLLLAVLAAGALSAPYAAGAAGLRDRDEEAARQTLRHGGIERGYLVRVPAGLPPDGRRVPLVLVLHGGGGNAPITERTTGFTAKGAAEGFIVVYPEGSGRHNDKLLTWNAGHCCGHALREQIDDVGFIDALLDRLIQDYPIDASRIYATGLSNGGMMTHRLGIELSHRIAAIAPVVATLFGDEPAPRHPVAALMINGMQDASVPYRGGAPGGLFAGTWDGTPAQPALAQAAFWAAANHCAEGTEEDRSGYLLRRYRCPSGQAVQSYLVKDNGHAWPGGQPGTRLSDKPSTALNATDVIWEFFKTRTKSEAAPRLK